MKHSIDRHLERYLGPIARGWSTSGDMTGVQVCLFEERPAPGVVTYATLGLSRHLLDMPRGRQVRHELLLSASVSFAHEDLAKLLLYLAEGLLREHKALLRGQVLPLGHPVAPASGCDSIYVARPVVFPEGLATCVDTQPPTVFPWLVPVHAAEATLVSRLGWNEFEDRLERVDPDLFNLGRPPVA